MVTSQDLHTQGLEVILRMTEVQRTSEAYELAILQNKDPVVIEDTRLAATECFEMYLDSKRRLAELTLKWAKQPKQ